MAVSGGGVPAVLRLLAEPVRWQLACELSRGDHRVRELVAATGHSARSPVAAALLRHRVHWSLPGPATGEGGLAGPPAFERMAADLDTRIRFLLPAIDTTAPGAA